GADHRDRDGGDETFGAYRVDQRAARHLSGQRNRAADRQHDTDVDLGPGGRGEIVVDERTEARLHVGDEEDEPVEPAQARARRMRRLLAGGARGGGDTSFAPCAGGISRVPPPGVPPLLSDRPGTSPPPPPSPPPAP